MENSGRSGRRNTILDDEKALYTVGEIAAKLGMSWSWTDGKLREGKIEFIRMGGERKIKREELARILRDGVA